MVANSDIRCTWGPKFCPLYFIEFDDYPKNSLQISKFGSYHVILVKLVTDCICCHVREEVVDETWDPL